MARDFWTPERVALLRLRWSEAATASAIALEIGCTANAVIGRAQRDPECAGRLNPAVRRIPNDLKPHIGGTKTPSLLDVPALLRGGDVDPPYDDLATCLSPIMQIAPRTRARPKEGISILDLQFPTSERHGDCRWPLGSWEYGQNLHNDPPTTLFCGQPAVDGKAYCGAHCRRAFQVVRR